MRILHTADWHVGKKLSRFDRMDDHAAVLDEIVHIADAERVDLVLVAGDLFDRPFPPVEALRLVMDTLRRLASDARPVVAIAGNHDSAELFELLASLVAPWNIHLVGEIKRPAEGGVLDLCAGTERALVACFPFLREGKVVDFMQQTDGWYTQYAERVALLCKAYNDHLERERDASTVALLMAHFVVSGVRLGGEGASRGERLLHMGESYAASEHAIPPGPQYVALGHVHAPQPVSGAAAPAYYAGSTLELDFGEAGEPKRVLLVDAQPGLPVEVRSRPLTAGRRLMRAQGTLAELGGREELKRAFVDLTVETDGPDDTLADRARDVFPYLVKVLPHYDRDEVPEALLRQDMPWDRLYEAYFLAEYEKQPGAELLAAFRQIYDEVG